MLPGMGFRFRRSIKLFPGLKVNVSKTGISESIGRPGATVNFRGDRTKTPFYGVILPVEWWSP